MESLTLIGLVLFSLAASAFFSGSETALLRVREHDLEEDVKAARTPGAIVARELLASPSRLLVTILLGNNVVNIMGALFGRGPRHRDFHRRNDAPGVHPERGDAEGTRGA